MYVWWSMYIVNIYIGVYWSMYIYWIFKSIKTIQGLDEEKETVDAI